MCAQWAELSNANLFGDLNNFSVIKLSLTEPRSSTCAPKGTPDKPLNLPNSKPSARSGMTDVKTIQVKQTILLVAVRISNKGESKTTTIPCQHHIKADSPNCLSTASPRTFKSMRGTCRCPGATSQGFFFIGLG